VLVEQDETGKYGLSRRELEVLTLAARGLSNRQIATGAHLAEGTVKRHLSNSYHKMEVGSRGEAVRKALIEGWLDVRDLLRTRETRAPTKEIDALRRRGSQKLWRPAG